MRQIQSECRIQFRLEKNQNVNQVSAKGWRHRLWPSISGFMSSISGRLVGYSSRDCTTIEEEEA
jgi:hypothetical protein